jgi:5-(carboxyamino)imidazole ribonucleotide synthase
MGQDSARSSIGMVGAGQLARMAWQAAISLDLKLVCLGADGDAAARVGVPLLEGSGRDGSALADLAQRCDVLTFEHELVDLAAVAELEARGVPVRPSCAALELAVDKLHQRRVLSAPGGAAVPAYTATGSLKDVDAFAAEHAWPLVLKARSGGYDGRGVWMCSTGEEAQAAFAEAAAVGLELYVEEAVDLALELAVIVARSPSGEIAVYAPVETNQVDGMCRSVLMPAGIPAKMAIEVENLARTLAEHIGLEGIMAVELFVTRDGRVLVNELALRTHNTGHLHTEASTTSQFEQHLRAVLDLPLGLTTPVAAAAAMVNVVGPSDGSDPASRLAAALSVPGARVHLYGKSARAGRKLGHVTVAAATPEQALALAQEAADRLERNV